MTTTIRVQPLLTLVLALALAIPATAGDQKNADIENIGSRDINSGSINFTSIEEEMQLGRQLAVELERELSLIRDPIITEYVNRIGQNLVRSSDAEIPFTIKVVDSDEINAFALPGGYLYVNAGLIAVANSEAELAGVLAHEIAHVTARHGTENQSKEQLVSLATMPLIFLGGTGGAVAQQAAGFLVPVTFLKFSRSAEEEADLLGIQYMYLAGYDPAAMISMFETLQAQETSQPGSISTLFSSHPATEDRIGKTRENIEEILPAREQYVSSTLEFEAIKGQLLALDGHRSADSERTGSLGREPASDETTETDDDDPPVLRRRKVLTGSNETSQPSLMRRATNHRATRRPY